MLEEAWSVCDDSQSQDIARHVDLSRLGHPSSGQEGMRPFSIVSHLIPEDILGLVTVVGLIFSCSLSVFSLYRPETLVKMIACIECNMKTESD